MLCAVWASAAKAYFFMAIPHNSKCRYGERGAADAKPKAQIILDAAKVSAASGGNSEPKQGQRSQSARGFCPRSTMRVPQPDIIEHFGNADAVPQLPERCLSRKAGIVRCCLRLYSVNTGVHGAVPAEYFSTVLGSAILLTQKHSAACFTRKHWLGQYRIILSADTASEVRQMPCRSCRSGA